MAKTQVATPPRPGRPRKGETRAKATSTVLLRLTAEERDTLRTQADAVGLSVSRYVASLAKMVPDDLDAHTLDGSCRFKLVASPDAIRAFEYPTGAPLVPKSRD